MGGRSKSSNSTTNNVTNYSLQGMESAETVVAGDGNTVTTTDHGAVNGALAFAENAIEVGGDIINANSEVSKKAITANGDLANNALKQGFGFGESALKANGQALSDSFDFGKTAIESNSEALQTGFGFAESLVQQNTANSAATNLAVQELAKSVASGGASDVTDLTTKTVYTIGAVIAVVVLAMLITGRRK